MKQRDFDNLARLVILPVRRRQALALLVGSVGAALLGKQPAAAQTPLPCPPNTKRCFDRCIPLSNCCTDAQCPGELVCLGGFCALFEECGPGGECPDGFACLGTICHPV